MEIIVGRMSKPAFITKQEMSRYKRNFENLYLGDKSVVQDIEPVACSYKQKNYSSLYMFDPQSAEFLPFDWIYFIKEEWLKESSDKIYNHSFSNHEEFEKFAEEMEFKALDGEHSIVKERNHLLTELDIPFNSIEKIIVKRSDPDYCRTVSHIRKYVDFVEERPISRNLRGRIVPAGIEFILQYQ